MIAPRQRRMVLVAVMVGLAALSQVPVTGDARRPGGDWARAGTMEFDSFSAAPLGQTFRLLFIHHSCGGQLLASPGPERGPGHGIYETHPNGGGLRARLREEGFEVHEASYGSELGERTDMFDWLPKFRDGMGKVLEFDQNDRPYPGGKRNEIVLWKSCFPNNSFEGEGEAPGDPRGPTLTVCNAKATLSAALPPLATHPEALFIYFTAPPLSPEGLRKPAWKRLADKIRGRASAGERAAWAREFNGWVSSPEGWLKGYPRKNVVVFDYYDLLTQGGATNFLAYPTANAGDSHPSNLGNTRAAEQFSPFLNRAIRRAGLGLP